jgi:hypothetical protein
MSADDDIEGWGAIFLSIIVGLLALWFFLAMGGIFALVGPWMILAVRHLTRQKWGQEGGKAPRAARWRACEGIGHPLPTLSVSLISTFPTRKPTTKALKMIC